MGNSKGTKMNIRYAILTATLLLAASVAQAEQPSITFARGGKTVSIPVPGKAEAVRLVAFKRFWTTAAKVENSKASVKVPTVRVPTVFTVLSTGDPRISLGELVAYPTGKVHWDKKITLYSAGAPKWFDQWASAVGLPVKKIEVKDLAQSDEQVVLIVGRGKAGKSSEDLFKLIEKYKKISVVVLEADWFGKTVSLKKGLTVSPAQMADSLAEIGKQKWSRPLIFTSRAAPWPNICNRWTWIGGKDWPLVEEIKHTRFFPNTQKEQSAQRFVLSYIPWYSQLGRREEADATFLAILRNAAKQTTRRWSMVEMLWPDRADVKAEIRPVVSAALNAWPMLSDIPSRVHVLDLRGKGSPPRKLLKRLNKLEKLKNNNVFHLLTPLLILGDDPLLDKWKWVKNDRKKMKSRRAGVTWIPDDLLPPSKKQQLRLMQILTEKSIKLMRPIKKEKKREIRKIRKHNGAAPEFLRVPESKTYYLKTWAVISSDKLGKSGLTDLLSAGLSREKGITLVDRRQLKLVTKELELKKMFGPAGIAQRVGTGKILKADALVLLTDEIRSGKNFVKIVISDCLNGGRLRIEYLRYESGKTELLVGKLLALIRKTRLHYSDGIKHVFGVPHFVSRNLVHDYDYLQAGFAHMLGSSLASLPGVAVIETQEAHRIRREIDITDGAGVKRIVPLFVEGEFKIISPTKGKEPSVRISLKITDGSKTVRTIKPQKMPLSAAAKYLHGLAHSKIFNAKIKLANNYSIDSQFTTLVARGDTFAMLGSWKNSTALREAALLLNPDDVKQRILVIQEIYRIVTAQWPRGAVFGDGDKAFERLCRSRLTRRRRALGHVEYLIRNRQVSRSVATKLVRDTMRSISTVRATWSSHLGKEELRKKKFLLKVYPLILNIPPKSKKKPGLEMWQGVLVDIALLRWDGNFLLKEDLDFLYKILTEVVPDNLPLSLGIVQRFCDYIPHKLTHGDTYKHYRFSSKEYLGFLSRLKQSGKSQAVIHSRYGQLFYEWFNSRNKADKTVLKGLLARCEALLSERRLKRNRYLYGKLRDLRGYIHRRLKPVVRIAQAPAPGPKRSTGRLVFEKVPLNLKPLGDRIEPLDSVRWRATHGWGGIQYITKCGDSLDVMWQNGAVMFMRKKDLAEEVFVDKKPYFCDVRWDGRNVWIATRLDGIWIVSPKGKLLGKVGKKQGLPPSDRGLLLHPIAQGKVCAIGSFGQHHRAWCAIVGFDGKTGKVEIFHRATCVPMAGQNYAKVSADKDLVFKPYWVHELDSVKKDGGRVLLVGRVAPSFAARRRPLLINLKSLRVSIFQQDLRPADNMSSQSYFSRNGKIVEGKRLLYHNGWVYGVGLAWYRINPKTWKSERLNPGRLPGKYILHTHGYHAISAHYGLVAWDFKGNFYSIGVKDKPLTAKAARKKDWFGMPYRVINVKHTAGTASKITEAGLK